MKTNKLKIRIPVLTLASIVALTLLFACKPKSPPTESGSAETPAPTAPAAPAPEAVAPAAPAAAAAPASLPTGMVRYDAQPTGSKMKMEGTSNIHDWTMESVNLGGFIEADASFPESALTDAKAAKPTVAVFMYVRTFKSNSKTMDERMQKSMKEPQFKKIEYKLIELKSKSAAAPTSGVGVQFDATGALTVAGTTRTNTMPVTIEKKDGKLKVMGGMPLKMTDYGVEPPALTIAGMGLKTGDDIKLAFEWVLAAKAP